jgi:signal transduction histidine kinase
VTENPRGRPWPTRLATVSGSLVAALGLTVLIGWFSHAPLLIQLRPGLPAMTRNAAACFLLCGLALLMKALGTGRWPVVACAGIAGVVSVLTIGEHVFGADLGVDELLGPAYVALLPSIPGRMAPVSAVCFALGSMALLMARRSVSKGSAWSLGLSGSIIAAIGMATSMAIALGSNETFRWGHVTRVALHTAVGFWGLGFGMLALAWRAETDAAGTPRWLPVSATIGVATSAVGLWQALVAEGHAPFAPLPAAVLSVGCLMALTFGLTVHLGQRARAQAVALRRSEAFLAEAQRLSSTGSFSWCVATDEITWSEQLYRIFEFHQGVRVTLDLIRTRVHPEDIPSLHDAIGRARSTGSFIEYELRLQMSDYSIKYLHMVAHATRGKDNQLEYIGAVQDVTQGRASAEALGKVRSELSRVSRVTSLGVLTASIAHEVNQPLSGIITNAGTCLRMLATDPPNLDGARETARRTIRDGNRASDLVKRLRALFGTKDAITERLDLNEATREVIAMSLSRLQSNRVILRSELADDLPPITGDRVQLQQVILNLLRNASDAMSDVQDRPRQLVIRTEREEGDRVRVTVQDTGVGLEPQGADRLFEAFYTTKSGGMGIGLSVSRSIIESHQGRLWAAPNDGPGATFSFSIPCEPEGVTGVPPRGAGPTPAVTVGSWS